MQVVQVVDLQGVRGQAVERRPGLAHCSHRACGDRRPLFRDCYMAGVIRSRQSHVTGTYRQCVTCPRGSVYCTRLQQGKAC